MYIETLKQKGRSITITGNAESNARVSAFMRALEDSAWFNTPALDVINTKSTGTRKDRTFTLKVNQDSPDKTEADSPGKAKR
jgi:type IV pilus assembly protein PilN